MRIKHITTEEDLQIAFHIRKEVFVKEQHCPVEDEFDEFDSLEAPCEHILIFHETKPVGTGRVRIVEDAIGKLERICLLPDYRKLGLGKTIIATLENIVAEQEIKQVKLHGQVQAERFYHKLGYTTSSSMFMEDGIPHVLLRKNLAETTSLDV